MSVIRVAAIGVGHWHALYDAAYLRLLAGMEDVQLVGLHDPSAAVAAERAVALGNPPVFTDYRAMLDKTRPDFVVALAPHAHMAETALALIDLGYPFMMEKPMGVRAAEVEAVAAAAAARRAFVAVPLSQRYQPFVVRARRMLSEGRFGALSHLYFRLNRPTSARYPAWGSPWMLEPALAGGGCLRNLGAHGLDLFLHLTGEGARVTAAQLSARVHGQPVEDYAAVLLRSTSGVLGTIEVGNTVPYAGSDGEWKVAGRDAILVLYHDDMLRLITAAGEETLTERPPALYRDCVGDLLDHFRRGLPPPISVHDLLPVVRLIDDAYALAGGQGGASRG
ncbi:MAG TPA: Gfo/Idh/MocA family oxidoreductase [Methylomirabilota bacterium]|jgi:predicted dehydrogenase|nr:Gfo/Idh/MocA family oxidoreductase [Methylomirabilota bacterium]